MQQAMRAGIRALRSSSSSSSSSSSTTSLARSRTPFNVASSIFTTTSNGVGGGVSSSRAFSQLATSAVSSPSTFLEIDYVAPLVLNLLRSFPFIDPSKVSPAASFKDDLQLDMLEKVEVMMAVEEEFAVDIPETEANKISTTGQLIQYITTNPQAKQKF